VRILHVCQPTDGGAAVVVRELVGAGVRAGDEVIVAGPRGPYLAEWVIAAGARWVELPMTRQPSPRDLLACLRVRRLLVAADVAHLHSSKAGAVGRLAAFTMRARRPRIVFTPHGWSWYVGGSIARAYRLFERVAVRMTDVVTVVSVDELRAGRAVLGPEAPIELIENGVDVSAFTPVGPLAPREPEPLVVQVGRLSIQKGQDRALRALASLADRSVRLRFVGEGPQRVALEQLAIELGVRDRVEYAGSVDPRPHLRCADVVILPSRWEGMSLVLLEAMAVGAPVIASSCGGSDALAGCGRLVDHEDDARVEGELGRAITELLGDRVHAAQLGAKARQRAVDSYALDGVLARYHKVWRAEAD
jgi:glycosyltransferase involved in cell wall biosynthesis